MSTNTEKPASRPSSAAQNTTAPVSTLNLDSTEDKSSVADNNQQNPSAVQTLATTFLPGLPAEQPAATEKPQSRASSAVNKSNVTTSASRPSSAKPNVDDATAATSKTSHSRVSSANKATADASTPVDDESHGYSINIAALPSSATPNSDESATGPTHSRPPSATANAKQDGSRPGSAAGQPQTAGSRPSSAANPKPTGSRPPSAANGKVAGSRPPSASIKSDQENLHVNPTEPVIGHPTATTKKESNDDNHANATTTPTESHALPTTSNDATTTAKSPRPGSSSKH